jgi:hypothetical protein
LIKTKMAKSPKKTSNLCVKEKINPMPQSIKEEK